jgi:hypothetical protein
MWNRHTTIPNPIHKYRRTRISSSSLRRRRLNQAARALTPSAPAICNDVPEMPDRDQGLFPTTLQTPRRGLFPLPSSLRSVIHDLLFFLSFCSALFPNSPSSLETAKGNEARASKRSAAKPSLTPPHRRPTSETGGKKQAAACLPAKKGQSDREEGKGKREAGIGLEDGARRRLSPI